jgi:hypothetical protein
VSHNDIVVSRCGQIDLFATSILSTRTSKTEFVCKSCGQLKFAVENRQKKLTKLSKFRLNSDCTSRNGSTRLQCGFDFFFPLLLPLDWRPKPNSRTLKKARMKLGRTNKSLCAGGGGSIWRGGGRIWWSSGASVRRRRDYGDSNSKL